MQTKVRSYIVSMSMSVRLSSVGINKALGIEEWNSEQFWSNDTDFEGTRIRTAFRSMQGRVLSGKAVLEKRSPNIRCRS